MLHVWGAWGRVRHALPAAQNKICLLGARVGCWAPSRLPPARRIEISWVRDDRSRVGLNYTEMAGVRRGLVIARTQQGQEGTAGAW